MTFWRGAGFRRLLAALVLVVGVTPTAFELVLHGPDAGEPLHHVEAASVTHHADHCLGAWATAEQLADGRVRPLVVTLPDAAQRDPAAEPVDPRHHPPTLPLSRAPPDVA